jgi:hypothetical protein
VGRTLPRSWLRADTESRAYLLPPGADVTARAGEPVRAGDAIANLPPLRRIVALVDGLHLSHEAGVAAIQALDNTPVEAGDLLGRHRTGLRMRTLHAPSSGKVRGIPSCGVVTILPSEECQVFRAERPGVVATIEPDRVTIVSSVLRCRLAIATGVCGAYARLALTHAGRDEAKPERPGPTEHETVITALPHISTMAELAAALRRAPGPLIVGTVSEAVAWEMCIRQMTGSESAGEIVAALLGPGDIESGERAIERLRTFDRAMLDLDPQNGAMTILTEGLDAGQTEEMTNDQSIGAAFFVDPARWHLPCTVAGNAALGLLETGTRAMLVPTRATEGEVVQIPVLNIAKCADS